MHHGGGLAIVPFRLHLFSFITMLTKHQLLSSEEWLSAPDDATVMAYVRKYNSPVSIPRRFSPTSIYHRLADNAIILCDFSDQDHAVSQFSKAGFEKCAPISEASDDSPVYLFYNGCLREADGVRVAHTYADGRVVFEMDGKRVSAECSNVTNKIILTIYAPTVK